MLFDWPLVANERLKEAFLELMIHAIRAFSTSLALYVLHHVTPCHSYPPMIAARIDMMSSLC